MSSIPAVVFGSVGGFAIVGALIACIAGSIQYPGKFQAIFTPCCSNSRRKKDSPIMENQYDESPSVNDEFEKSSVVNLPGIRGHGSSIFINKKNNDDHNTNSNKHIDESKENNNIIYHNKNNNDEHDINLINDEEYHSEVRNANADPDIIPSPPQYQGSRYFLGF